MFNKKYLPILNVYQHFGSILYKMQMLGQKYFVSKLSKRVEKNTEWINYGGNFQYQVTGRLFIKLIYLTQYWEFMSKHLKY